MIFFELQNAHAPFTFGGRVGDGGFHIKKKRLSNDSLRLINPE
jgi:hypothetical protein